jgi:hypothetical protein
VHAYGALQANWRQFGHKLSLTVLHLPTMIYHRYPLAGYNLSIAAALLLTVKNPQQAGPSVMREVLLKVVNLAALIWLLGAFLAWQLPLYYPVALVE